MKHKKHFLENIFNDNPPTLLHLGLVELRREGISIDTHEDIVKNFDKILNRATKIRDTFCRLQRKKAYTSKVGKAYIKFIRETGTLKQYKKLLKQVDRAKRKRKK